MAEERTVVTCCIVMHVRASRTIDSDCVADVYSDRLIFL